MFHPHPSLLRHYQSHPCNLEHWIWWLNGGWQRIRIRPRLLNVTLILNLYLVCYKCPQQLFHWMLLLLLDYYWKHILPFDFSLGLPTWDRIRGLHQEYYLASWSFLVPLDWLFFNLFLRAYIEFYRQSGHIQEDFKMPYKIFSIFLIRPFQMIFYTNPWNRIID